MDPDLQKLTDEVTATTTVEASAVTLIGGLADKLRAAAQAATDLASLKTAVNAQADALDAGAKALGDAVAANTVAG
jgi:hypothetical protein